MHQSKTVKHFTATLTILILSLLQACAGPTQFARVDEFPEGKQSDIMTSAILSGIEMGSSIVERTYATPQARVWEAAKVATERLDKIGKRPVVGIDEQTKRIQNGRISQDALVGSGSGAWQDEFVTEITSLSDNQTKVSVSRRVIGMTMKRRRTGYEREWRSQKSNGQIENWVLTQIENQLTK